MWLLPVSASVASAQQPQFDVPPPRDLWVKVPVQAEEWPRHFRIGMLVGMNVKADFSMSGQFPVSGSQPGGAWRTARIMFMTTATCAWMTRATRKAAPHIGVTTTRRSTTPRRKRSPFTAPIHSAPAEAQKARTRRTSGLIWPTADSLGVGGRRATAGNLVSVCCPSASRTNSRNAAVINRTVHSFDTGNILLPTAPYNGGPSGIGPTIQDNATAAGRRHNSGNRYGFPNAGRDTLRRCDSGRCFTGNCIGNGRFRWASGRRWDSWTEN